MPYTIEKEAVSVLISEVGEATAMRLYGIFRTECETFSAALETEFQQGNTEQICIIAHSLKSSARQFGANRLSDLCRTLEALSESAAADSVSLENDEISAALSDVKSESARVQSRLDEMLADNPDQPPA